MDENETKAGEAESDLAADPILGDVIANYPSDRVRLLLIGGGIYAVVAFTINLAFLPVDPQTASIIVIGAMAILALVIGWGILHSWNHEVIVYSRGFSYREGSRVVFFMFNEISGIHLHLERYAYFGGLIRRTIRRMTLTTVEDETIILDNRYKRIEELIGRLERAITPALKRNVEAQFAAGRSAAFGSNLSLSPEGITAHGKSLPWSDYAGYNVSGGALVFRSRTADQWASVSLNDLDNLALLVELLNEHTAQ